MYGALLEVTKYISSPDKSTLDIDNIKFSEMFQALKKKRSKATFGLFRGSDKNIDADILNEKEKDIIDFACRLCQMTEYEFMEMLTTHISKYNIICYD